jgi:D-alanyl-D-alanine carboxypeptidase
LLACSIDKERDSAGAKFVRVQPTMARSLLSGWMTRAIGCVVLAVTLALLAACGSHYGPRYSNLELTPGRDYPRPGSPGDPWGPYIRQAAQRFDVPERWIRAVIQQESAGEVQALSPAGAMGLMQLMPGTYEMLREEYDLGNDPFEPHDNILAGSAYIRQMYERYGAPGFLAAYNAGPDRVDDYLTNGDPLPAETVSYLSNVAPQLGSATPMTGPLSAYAGNNAAYAGPTGGCNLNAAYDPGHPCSALPVPQAPVTLAATGGGYCDPNAAYDPDRRCMPAPRPITPLAPVQAASNGPSISCDPDAAYDPDRPCTSPPPSTAPSASVHVASNAPFGDCDADAAYDPHRPCLPAPQPNAAVAPVHVASNAPSEGCDSDAAYDPTRPCTPGSATQPVTPPSFHATASLLYQPEAARPLPTPQAVQRVSAAPGLIRPEPTDTWAIQVGAFMTPSAAHAAAANARRALPALLTPARVEVSTTEPFGSQVLFRARLTNLTADSAVDACSRLVQVRMPCLIVRPS